MESELTRLRTYVRTYVRARSGSLCGQINDTRSLSPAELELTGYLCQHLNNINCWLQLHIILCFVVDVFYDILLSDDEFLVVTQRSIMYERHIYTNWQTCAIFVKKSLAQLRIFALLIFSISKSVHRSLCNNVSLKLYTYVCICMIFLM